MEYLDRAVQLLNDPNLVAGSDTPEKQPDHNPGEPLPTKLTSPQSAMELVAKDGFGLVANHFVVGRSGPDELFQTARVMLGIIELTQNQVSLEVASHVVRADMLFEFGNVLRKMNNDNDKAIQFLKMADLELQKDNGRRHLNALMLIPDIINTDMHRNTTNNPVLKKEKASRSIQEARDVLAIAEEVDMQNNYVYYAKIILASLICNSFALGFVEPTQETMMECVELAQQGYLIAMEEKNDTRAIQRAQQVLSHFE